MELPELGDYVFEKFLLKQILVRQAHPFRLSVNYVVTTGTHYLARSVFSKCHRTGLMTVIGHSLQVERVHLQSMGTFTICMLISWVNV